MGGVLLTKWELKLKTLNPGAVNFGDLVFLGGDLLENYFMNYHPHINNKYILIIHNSTESWKARKSRVRHSLNCDTWCATQLARDAHGCDT